MLGSTRVTTHKPRTRRRFKAKAYVPKRAASWVTAAVDEWTWDAQREIVRSVVLGRCWNRSASGVATRGRTVSGGQHVVEEELHQNPGRGSTKRQHSHDVCLLVPQGRTEMDRRDLKLDEHND